MRQNAVCEELLRRRLPELVALLPPPPAQAGAGGAVRVLEGDILKGGLWPAVSQVLIRLPSGQSARSPSCR